MSSSTSAASSARGRPAAITREAFVQLESEAGRRLPVAAALAALDHAIASAPSLSTSQPPLFSSPAAVIDFWRDEGLAHWCIKDPEFDRRFRERFLPLYDAAVRGELAGWPVTPLGALALILLLDQFPRNAFRDTPRMYATDTIARAVADAVVEAGYDRKVEPELRLFFYLPFGHSENLADQERSVSFCRGLGEPHLSHAGHHRDIVRRFGRFPHRNPILGRTMTAAEQHFLDEGGFAG